MLMLKSIISIIICSRQPDISDELKENIQTTIGCEYELVVIDNSQNQYSIFSAYNEGVRCAKGDILCFMHEDILFHSLGWGNVVKNFFANHLNAGLIGVVGGQFIPKTVAYWCDGGCDYGQIIQGFIGEDGHYASELRGNVFQGEILEVAAVDGQWFCIPKMLFSQIFFDEEYYSGFHSYDMDICLQILQIGYKCYITNQILLEHQSAGSDDARFLYWNERFYEKWKDFLPIQRGINLSLVEMRQRTTIVDRMHNYMRQYHKLDHELNVIRNSASYRLGRLALYPIHYILRTCRKSNKG